MSSFITSLSLIFFDLTLILSIDGPYIFSAFLISATYIVKFDIMLVYTMSLSILTWTPLISSMLNIGGYSSLLGGYTSGTFGTVPSGLHASLYLPTARPPPKRL